MKVFYQRNGDKLTQDLFLLNERVEPVQNGRSLATCVFNMRLLRIALNSGIFQPTSVLTSASSNHWTTATDEVSCAAAVSSNSFDTVTDVSECTPVEELPVNVGAKNQNAVIRETRDQMIPVSGKPPMKHGSVSALQGNSETDAKLSEQASATNFRVRY